MIGRPWWNCRLNVQCGWRPSRIICWMAGDRSARPQSRRWSLVTSALAVRSMGWPLLSPARWTGVSRAKRGGKFRAGGLLAQRAEGLAHRAFNIRSGRITTPERVNGWRRRSLSAGTVRFPRSGQDHYTLSYRAIGAGSRPLVNVFDGTDARFGTGVSHPSGHHSYMTAAKVHPECCWPRRRSTRRFGQRRAS